MVLIRRQHFLTVNWFLIVQSLIHPGGQVLLFYPSLYVCLPPSLWVEHVWSCLPRLAAISWTRAIHSGLDREEGARRGTLETHKNKSSSIIVSDAYYFSHFGCGTGEIVTVDVSIYLHFVAFLPRSHSDLCRLMAVMVCKSSLTALIYISHCWSRPGDFLIWLHCHWLRMKSGAVPVHLVNGGEHWESVTVGWHQYLPLSTPLFIKNQLLSQGDLWSILLFLWLYTHYSV